MARRRESRFVAERKHRFLWALLVCSVACAGRASAQAAVEAAGATSASASAAVNLKPVQVLPTIPVQTKPGSAHIVGSPSAQSVELNRKALEAKAGADGARVLLRSTPSEARVWVNNRPVGSTPLLLIVPPGKYSVEMRGSRQESGRMELALLPKETRDVSVKLEVRYPTRVAVSH